MHYAGMKLTRQLEIEAATSDLVENILARLFIPSRQELVRRVFAYVGYVKAEDAERLGTVIEPEDVEHDPLEMFVESRRHAGVSRFELLFHEEAEECATLRTLFVLNV